MGLEDETRPDPLVPLGLKLEQFALQNPDVRTIPLAELLGRGLLSDAEIGWATQSDVLLESIYFPEDLPGSVRFNFKNQDARIVWSAPGLRTAERMTVAEVRRKLSERAVELGRHKRWRIEGQGLTEPSAILITEKLFFVALPSVGGNSRRDQISRMFEQHSLPPPRWRSSAVSLNIMAAPPEDCAVLADIVSEVLRLGFELRPDQFIEIGFGW
jgi:hypothetical protein